MVSIEISHPLIGVVFVGTARIFPQRPKVTYKIDKIFILQLSVMKLLN